MMTQLNVHHLRNLSSLSIHPSNCNLITGNNGSGKTSLIEAIYLLARGKSFRHYQPKRYISHGASTVTIHARFDNNNTMAIQKSTDATTLMRIDNQAVYAQSLLTKRLPTLLIDPSSMDMLEVGSGSRRQLLDWIVFHVKPNFHTQWLAYQRLLKQRNSLLRTSVKLYDSQRLEIMAWDKSLADHAMHITQYRQQVFEIWSEEFDRCVARLLPQYAMQIKLKFMAGYDTQYSLDVLLKDRMEQDCHMGYTRLGCHRSDVQILWYDNQQTKVKDQAANVLSRGEKKLLITALKLSQLSVLINANFTNTDAQTDSPQPIVLLDDIGAELDDNALTLLLNTLAQTPCQLFITNLDTSIQSELSKHWQHFSLFHMKQGGITDINMVTT